MKKIRHIPYIYHLMFDILCNLLVYKFFGFNIAVIWVLTNIDVDLAKGFEGYFKLKEKK